MTTNAHPEGGGAGPCSGPDAYEELIDCTDVARHGSLALDGYLPRQDVFDVARHVQVCGECAASVGQLAATSALLGGAARTRDIGSAPVSEPGVGADSSSTLEQTQQLLLTLARAADAEHADELVQETWDHFLGVAPGAIPAREELADYLLQHVDEHRRDEEVTASAWADDLLRHHPHDPADLAESDLPPDPGGYDSLRDLADLDVLDPDADEAELLFPDLYGDGPDKGVWTSPPSGWPSVTRLLGPEAEVQTSELYSVVDAGLDELPKGLGDALYLVDVQGHSLETAAGLLGRRPAGLQRDLARARFRVRTRVDSYLAGR